MLTASAALAMILAACSGGSDNSDDSSRPAATSPAEASPAADTELAGTLVGPADLADSASTISALNCKAGQVAGGVAAEEVCTAGYRLADGSALSLGSYLLMDAEVAKDLAGSIAVTQARRVGGTLRNLAAPDFASDGAHIQTSAESGGKTQIANVIGFRRGRVAVYVSVVNFGDPTQETVDVARRAADKLTGHFGG